MFAQMGNTQITEEGYNAGIYVRLSREDENTNESESIQNQKDFLTGYVISKGWNLVDIYCDDGYTGTNFERPDFKRLVKDIEKGCVNLVITKDLSRLGRDYIETGNYLERYFPEHGIRYIAVNDGIDTILDSSNNDMSPFRSVINDMYARDISRKVRTVMDTKRKNGKFIGAFAPFGYRKSPTDKNKLVIDEAIAGIIRRVFELYVGGYGLGKIADILNSDKVITPNQYKSMNSNYINHNARINLWTANTIKCIINNPTYCGCLSQHKYSKVNYKVNKLLAIPRDNWIIIENTHDAIVDRKVFEKAQELMKSKVRVNYQKTLKEHLFSGLLFCGDCKESMTYTKTQKGEIYCICSKYKKYKRCTRHSILERELEECIISELKSFSLYAIDKEELYRVAKEQPHSAKIDDVKKDMLKNQLRQEELRRIIKSIYEDKLKGVLSEQDFIELSRDYGRERDELNERLVQFNKKVEALENSNNENNMIMGLVRDFVSFKSVDRYILSNLIERIEIFEGQRVEVHYKFKKPF